MAQFLQKVLGGAKSVSSSVSTEVDDFADFASAAAPLAPSHSAPVAASPTAAIPEPITGGFINNLFGNPAVAMRGRPYTKWYRVWERVTLRDFYQELFILPILLLIIIVNLLGSYANKKRAKAWASKNLPLLTAEFAQVGFSRGDSSASSKEGNVDVPDSLLRQKAKNEYFTYATGRQNIAYAHIQLTLFKRYNPVTWFLETALSFFFDSMSAPVERVEATLYPFDGREKAFTNASGGGSSTYDGFVFAIVHKDKMQKLRDDRYDLSLTATRDHAKLPEWATVMSESAEVTEAMLTPDLVKAVKEAGEDLEALVITDQGIDAPKKLNDTIPNKRVGLSMKLSSSDSTSALFQYFLRLPDVLVANAHFRPEAMRRIRATREAESSKIRKADEEEKAEERRSASDKLKKEERDRKLNSMSAEEQRKFLDREKKDENKKGQKKRSMKA